MPSDTSHSKFFVAGGTLRPNTPSYVRRPADDELLKLTLAGEFCYVLTPRQMGKSSLMIRTARRLREQEVKTAIIDLTRIGTDVSVEQWYLGLLAHLRRSLRLSVDTAAWWRERAELGVVQRFVDFLRDVVLAECNQHIVIFVDEIDSTLALDFRDDFFAAIRAMYNARAEDPEFARLTFVLLGVAAPTDLIADPARTPFNIGQGIALQEFSRADAAVLQTGLEAVYPDQGEAIFDRIYHWTHGHPYLTQKLCLAIAETRGQVWSDTSVDALVNELFLAEAARNEANLKFVQDKLLNYPRPQRDNLLKLYRRVLSAKAVEDDGQSPIHNQLKLSGLVKAEDGVLRVRNEIYRHVFNPAWVRENVVTNPWPIVAGVAALIAVSAISAILYNAWVGIQLDSCVAGFYQTNVPEERGAHLAKVFKLRGLLGPTDYDYRARELFYGLSRVEQLALFDVDSTVDTDLVEVVKGLYVTLADVDGTDSTTQLLEAMADASGRLDETEEIIRLRDEINYWLLGRELARQGQHDTALAAYDAAIALNGENPATLYERAGSLIELSRYQEALSDLDRVVAIAGEVPAPTPTPPAPTVASAVTSIVGGENIPTPDATIYIPTSVPGSVSPTSTLTSGETVSSSEILLPDMTTTSTSVLFPTETPVPTPTPLPVSVVSEFATFGQMIRVRFI